MGLRPGLWLLVLATLGATLVGCGAEGARCSETAPIDTVAVASTTGSATRTGSPAIVSVRLLSAPTAAVDVRPENRSGLLLSADVLRFEAGEQGPKSIELRVPTDWVGNSWTLGFSVSTGSDDSAFRCIAMTPVSGTVGAGGCGDGVVADDEQCDPGPDGFNLWARCDYGETSCQVCSPYTCRFEPGQPSYCGDGMVDPASDESCDGDPGLECDPPVGAVTGYVAGEVRCDGCRVVRECTWYGDCSTVTGACVTMALPDPAPPTHSCVLRGATAECFGDNVHGQSRPPDGEAFVALDTGKGVTCGLRTDGTIRCWGDDAYGKATPPSGTFTELALMPETGCAIAANDGSVRCWGRQDFFMNPVPTSTGLHALTAGGLLSCALDENERARCWGVVPFAPPDLPLSSVDAGYDSACGLDAEGTLHCWGRTRPAPVSGVSSPQPAGEGTCATHGDDIVCWGDGIATPTPFAWTQVADHARGACNVTSAGEIDCADPSCPDMNHATFVGVSVTGDTVCAVTDEGIVWCADCAMTSGGAPTSARQIAVDFTRRCSVDVAGTLRCRGFLDGLVLGEFEEVVAGDRHACARDADGFVYCLGELATSPPAGLRARALAATRRVACAVATDGTLHCWGDAQGLGNLASPPPGNDFVDLAMGDQHGCALRITGELRCWGYELSGELTPPSTLRLATLTEGSCGIDTNGAYVCWGATAPRFDEVVCWDGGCRALNASAFTPVSGFRADEYDVQPRDFGLATDSCRLTPAGALFFTTNAPIGECNGGASSAQRPPDGLTFVDITSVRNATGQVLCGLTAEMLPSVGTLRCWGAGFATGLSHPSSHIGTYTDVSLAVDQLCALQPNGLPRCFPDGVTPAPPAVALESIASSVGQTCGVASSDGRLVCWGNQALTPPSGAFEQVTLGHGFGCARDASGGVVCWGDSTYGAHVPPNGVRFLSIGATDTYVCGVDEDQRLRCWGEYAWNL